MPPQYLVIPVGIPGSGKSSYIKRHFPAADVVSPDIIRARMLNAKETGVYYNPEIEEYVWLAAYNDLEAALRDSDAERVVFDATNTTFKRRYPLVARALRAGVKVHIIFFATPLQTVLMRNANRVDGRPPVPDDVIARMRFQITPPESWEYDLLWVVHADKSRHEYTADPLTLACDGGP